MKWLRNGPSNQGLTAGYIGVQSSAAVISRDFFFFQFRDLVWIFERRNSSEMARVNSMHFNLVSANQ